MQRYRLLRERLEASGHFSPDQMCVPPAASDEQLLRVHKRDWIDRVARGELTSDEVRRIGFPWSKAIAERSRRSTGATIAAAECAWRDSVAANLAGGTHHAFPDRGAGYCVFNDVAVAIRNEQAYGRCTNVLVIDLDVHQGDGTASIFKHDDSVFTFSMHAKKAFPARKQTSSLDVELMPGCEDDEYLQKLGDALQSIRLSVPFDIIFFLAGADPYKEDTLGGLHISKNGLRQRDQAVFDCCKKSGTPLVITLAGGYSKDINDIVDIQFSTVTRAAESLSRS
ncbi:UNVERIFIED_CONTAM: hypothetical protein GTU68_053199 [Idotea baltica]|nr:hypothetical protein [Idotea baltica]